MFAKTLKRAGIGFLLGIAVGNVICFAGGGAGISSDLIAHAGSETGAMALQTIVMGLFGSFAMSGMSLYEIDSWPLALSTSVHYLMIALMYVIMDRVLSWNGSVEQILVVEFIQLIVFFIIWLFIYLRYRSEVRALNEELHEMQNNGKKCGSTNVKRII